MDLIPDPFDETQALLPDGRMAGRMFFIPQVKDVTAPTVGELRDAGVFAGWVDFNLFGVKPEDQR